MHLYLRHQPLSDDKDEELSSDEEEDEVLYYPVMRKMKNCDLSSYLCMLHTFSQPIYLLISTGITSSLLFSFIHN